MVSPRQVATYAGIGVASVFGLLGLLYAGGVIGLPDAGLESNEWGDVDDERIEILTTVWVDNPNPFGASVDSVDYDLVMNDVHLASGGSDEVALATGNETVTFQTDLYHVNVPEWWAAHVERDEVGDVEVTATVQTTVVGRTISRPVTYEDDVETDVEGMLGDALSELEGEYTGSAGDETISGDPIQPTVEVRDTDADWGGVTEDETILLATFDVHNPNAYPIPTPGFTGEFEMNDVTVLHWDANDVDVVTGPTDGVIPPMTTEEVVLQLRLDNGRFADWFATHVDADEQTDATLTTQLALSVGGSEVRMPADGSAMECSYDLQTSIFVEQPAGLEREDCALTTWETTRGELEQSDTILEDVRLAGSNGDDDGVDGVDTSDEDSSSGESLDDGTSNDETVLDGGRDVLAGIAAATRV